MSTKTLEPGSIIVADRGTYRECRFVVLPSSSGWTHALQFKGPGILEGEVMARSAPIRTGVFGSDFEIVEDEEFRLVASDGQIKCLVVPKIKV